MTPMDRVAMQRDRIAAIQAEIERRNGPMKATADAERQRILTSYDPIFGVDR